MEKKGSFKGLVPFIVFLIVYLGTGIILSAKGVSMAFYQLPAPVAIMPAIILAFFIFAGSIDDKFKQFLDGCGDNDIITMCVIYLLAGAFSGVASAMGGRDSVVNLGLSLVPRNLLAAGMFIIAAFMSTATGTSVGAISALAPIAVGLAEKSGVSMAFMVSAVLGGGMFGDNLSVISDTTIAATKSQGVEMKDKFRVNLFVALPAAVLTVILLVIFARPDTTPPADNYSFNFLKVVPYLAVLILALVGMNVFAVLTLGIALAGIIGLATGSFKAMDFCTNIYSGFNGMFEIFLLSMLTGGLAAMVRKAGGIDWIIEKMQGMMKSEKSTGLGIGILCALVDIAVANNTVAIIICGPIAKRIGTDKKVDPRKMAAILDIFACVGQGIIPYGAQALILLGFTNGKVAFPDILPLMWYQGLLLVFAVVDIFIPFADGCIRRAPWNFEKGAPERA